MATSICSGEITQSDDGTVFTFTDTGSYNPPVTSRILNIFDSNAILVQTINMGASLTATENITSDVYRNFVLEVVDSTGTFSCIVNYESIAFYQIKFAPAIARLDTPCMDIFAAWFNLFRAELNLESSLIFAERGIPQNAQALLTLANFYVNTPYYA